MLHRWAMDNRHTQMGILIRPTARRTTLRRCRLPAIRHRPNSRLTRIRHLNRVLQLKGMPTRPRKPPPPLQTSLNRRRQRRRRKPERNRAQVQVRPFPASRPCLVLARTANRRHERTAEARRVLHHILCKISLCTSSVSKSIGMCKPYEILISQLSSNDVADTLGVEIVYGAHGHGKGDLSMGVRTETDRCLTGIITLPLLSVAYTRTTAEFIHDDRRLGYCG